MKRANILSLILILGLCTIATAQTSGSSTPASQSRSATNEAQQKTLREAAETKAETKAARLDLCERELRRVLNEVKAARDLKAAKQQELDKLQARFDEEQRNSDSLANSYDKAQSEITHLRESIIALDKQIAAQELAIKLLTEQRDRARKQVRKARKQTAFVAAGAVTGAAICGPMCAGIGAGAGWLIGLFK